MDKPKLQAIFFDIDDTLFATSTFARQAHLSAMEAMVKAGVRMSKEDLFQELREVITEFSSNYPHHFDKLLVRLPAQVHSHVNKAILIAAAVVAYHDTKYASLAPYPDAVRLLHAISDLPVMRGIITAGLEVKQAEKLIRLDLYRYLTPDAIFISDQIGISKPNPKIYRYACKALQLDPSRTMYVGDNPLGDIDPPNQIGMITVRVRKGGKYNDLQGKTRAGYEIDNFDDLLSILHRDFEMSNLDNLGETS